MIGDDFEWVCRAESKDFLNQGLRIHRHHLYW